MNIKNIVNNLIQFGGIKIYAKDYNNAVSIRWSLNKGLRDLHMNGKYATAIIWSNEQDVVVAWMIEKYVSKRISEWINKDITYYTNIDNEIKSDINISINEPWIDPANEELMRQLANELKAKKKLESDRRLNDILNKL